MKNVGNVIKALPQALFDLLCEQYDQNAMNKILSGYLAARPTTLRVNTLRSDSRAVLNALWEAKIKNERVPWYNEAIIIRGADEKSLEGLDIYQKGHIYLQSLPSMLPALILNPTPGSNVLDLTAAPGGKTAQICALMGNKGKILANDDDPIRVERMRFNLARQGTGIVRVNLGDGKKLRSEEGFDFILLDAPCSGTGTITLRNPISYRSWSVKLLENCVKLQTKLLRNAFDLLKSGGTLVYSTCSILRQENEQIIDSLLETYGKDVVLEQISLPKLENVPRLPSPKGTLAICPSELYEGFFVARLRKK